MPFSTSFCLTNTGNLPSNTTLSFYSNVDGYTVPFQITVPLFSVTGNNCPFTLTGVPNGTLQIKVESSTGNCCAVVNVTPNDPCSFCELGFDSFSATTISQIVAGNLTGSCDANITDYLIEWYDVTNSNSPVFKFSSGNGTLFTYTYQHPLVNTTAVPVLPGLYKPYLRKVIINGITYTNNVEVGAVQANLDCFTTLSVNVSPLNCSNGEEEGDYTHRIQFSGASNGIQPVPLYSIFQLSADTNYIAWKFWGYDIADEIKLTYYGSNYNNQPIILEWFSVGNNNNGFNLYDTVFPKVTYTFDGGDGNDYFNKITCLTGITRSQDDYILIEVKPNIQNSKTNFKLLLQCLTSFNCESCFDSYYNSVGYPIIENSITLDSQTCNQLQVSLLYSGCSTNDVSNSDIYKYMRTSTSTIPNSGPGWLTDNGVFWFGNTLAFDRVLCSGGIQYSNLVCETPSNNTITFTKDNSGVGNIGNIYMTFSNIIDFNAYYNSYLTLLSGLGGIPTDTTQISYYRSMYLRTPNPTSVNDQCGDTTTSSDFQIHTTSVVTTGFTNNFYTLNFTMPTITNQMSFTNCELYCETYINSFVMGVNQSSTGSTNNYSYVNSKGNRYTSPFSKSYSNGIYNTPLTGFSSAYAVSYSKFLNETKPFSANTDGTYTYINSLSATTCNSFSNLTLFPGTSGYNDACYQQVLSFYRIEATNPLNINDFVIKASPLFQGTYNPPLTQYQFEPNPNNLITIYQNLNGVGTVLNPNYFI